MKKNQPGLFPDEQITNPNTGEDWTPKTTDCLLDMALANESPLAIARELKKSVKAVKRRLQQFLYDERKVATQYVPKRRHGRTGTKMTALEKRFVEKHAQLGVHTVDTAKILCRPPNEIRTDFQGELNVRKYAVLGPRVDMVLAYRYLYWIAKHPAISDQAYDTMKAEEIEFGGGYEELTKPPGKVVVDYPGHIRALAHYLLFKIEGAKDKPNKDCLPPYFFNELEKKKKI